MSSVDFITFNCPQCGKTLKVHAKMGGRQLTCPNKGCGAGITIPVRTDTNVAPLLNSAGGAIPAGQSGWGLKAQIMSAVGLAFAVIAVVLTIRELKLEAGWILSMVLVAVFVLSELFKGYVKAGLIAVLVVAGLSTVVLFFVLERKHDQRELAFYVGAALYFAMSCYLLVRTYGTWSQFEPMLDDKKLAIKVESVIVWFTAIVSSLAFSWVTYYRFLTPLGVEEFLVRRLIFTLFFVVVGVVCTVLGRSRRNSLHLFLNTLGVTYMAAGVIKALAYDSFKTTGLVRIGVFAGCAAVFLLGGFLIKPTKVPRETDTAANDSTILVVEETPGG